jgi:hypothetical protein
MRNSDPVLVSVRARRFSFVRDRYKASFALNGARFGTSAVIAGLDRRRLLVWRFFGDIRRLLSYRVSNFGVGSLAAVGSLPLICQMSPQLFPQITGQSV